MAHLTAGELEIMKILWEHGALKPAQIQEKFPRPIKNAAVRAALRILMEKEHVVRKKRGKAYYYTAVTPRQNAMKKMIRRVRDVFYAGSTTSLIAHLMETEKLSQEDIRFLKKVANQQLKRKT